MQSAMSFTNEHLLLAQNITDYDGCEKADTWTTESTGCVSQQGWGKKKEFIFFMSFRSVVLNVAVRKFEMGQENFM